MTSTSPSDAVLEVDVIFRGFACIVLGVRRQKGRDLISGIDDMPSNPWYKGGLEGNKLADHSPIGAAPTTSSFSTRLD